MNKHSIVEMEQTGKYMSCSYIKSVNDVSFYPKSKGFDELNFNSNIKSLSQTLTE